MPSRTYVGTAGWSLPRAEQAHFPPGASHLALLAAVAGTALVERAYAEAVRSGYRWHEFGDSCLLLP